MNGIRPYFPWRMWIPASIAVTVLTVMTGLDIYQQMRGQMVEIAGQATTVAQGQLAAILSAAEELLRSTEDRLKEFGDVKEFAARPEVLDAALSDVEAIIHGTGFGGLAAIDRAGKVIAVASDDDLLAHDFSGQPFIEQAFEEKIFALAKPMGEKEGAFAPLVYGVVPDDDEKAPPQFLLMTEIDVRFLDNFQSRLASSLVQHVALLDKSGATIVGSWPFDDDHPADVDVRRGVGGFDLVAAAGFNHGEVLRNVSSELLLLFLTYLTSMLAVTALSYAYAYRAQVGDLLKQVVEHKDVLHREAQHRVSGALQLISSLVSLQARDAQNERVSQALDTVKHRIAAILAVNGKLSGDTDGRQVDLGVYLESICDDLAASYEQKHPNAQIDTSFSSILCDGEKAVRFGLIVNELVTNAYRHAFAEGKAGMVTVRLARDDPQFHIMVADDGVGEGGDLSNPGIGLELVSLLAEQVNCSLERLPSDRGLTWRIQGLIADLAPDGGKTV
ncbi:MAG: histidine kinase dimerization/phosphoacceptor domain -containing protein [Alphaproteobacteria bacterium]